MQHPPTLRLATSLAVVLFATASCSDDGQPTQGPRANHASLIPVPHSEKGGDQTESEGDQAAPNSLVRVPADALLAFRVDASPDLSTSWKKLALLDALSELPLDGIQDALSDVLGEFRTEALDALPGGAAWMDLASSLRGSLTVALIDFEPGAADRGVMPFSVYLTADYDDDADDARRAIETIAKDPALAEMVTFGDAGRYRLLFPEYALDLHLGSDHLSALLLAGDTSGDRLDELIKLPPAASFLSTDLAKSESHDSTGSATWAEMFVNLKPLWATLRDVPDSQMFFETTGFDAISGLSLVSRLDGDRFHDTFRIHTDGRDVLSLILSRDRLDPSFLRRLDADADDAFAMTFNLGAALQAMLDRLPDAERQEAEYGIQMAREQAGVDPVGALSNLGPNYGFSARGDLIAAILDQEDFEAVVAIQVQDDDLTAALLDRLFQELPFGRVPRREGELRYSTLPLPIPDAPPWLELSFGQVDGALLIATSPAAYLRAASATENAPHPFGDVPKLADAFAASFTRTASKARGLWQMFQSEQAQQALRDGDLGVDSWPLPTDQQVERFAAKLPDSVTSWTVDAHGILFDSRSPVGAVAYGLVPVAVIAAIAIPNLVAARVSANENSAIATMRNLVSAQAQFQAMACADRDQDGVGEYGTFGELAGTAPLPDGSFLSPPVLSQRLGVVDVGAVEASGYFYRIFLPGPGREPLQELGSGGADRAVDADHAERDYWIYAWPADAGSTGNRAFYVDSAGDIFSSDMNDGAAPYAGIQGAPNGDAAWPTNPGARPGPQREAVDGRIWTIAW